MSVAEFHDPQREVEMIREHLGSSDGRLAFLVGAGTSAAVVDSANAPLIPTVLALGDTCRDAVAELGSEHAAAYDSVRAECESSLKAKAETSDLPVLPRTANVEDILSAVRTKLSAIGDGDLIAGLNRVQLVQVEERIRSTIAKAAFPSPDRIPERLPHHQFASWISRLGRATPIEIFTTNYDTLFERALEDHRLPVFDGFVGARSPFFLAASLARANSMPGPAWTRLWKIHGSINWSIQSFGDSSDRIVRGSETNTGELIFPSLHKYDESRKQPYAAVLDHLARLLDDPSGTLLVVLGYSFGDQHINEIIFDALDSRDRAHVLALQFDDLPDTHPLVSRAASLPNLLVLGPKTAIIGGVRSPWKLTDEVTNRTAALLDIAFDSEAAPEPDQTAMSGEFRLGDFNYFCAFLNSLAGNSDEGK